MFYTILVALVGFTLFLIYATILGRKDSCHCFGSLVDISPVGSIFKNIAMIGVLYLSRRAPQWWGEWIGVASSYILISLCAVAFFPLFKSPPRGFNELIYGKEGAYAVDVELFNEFIANNPQFEWGEKSKVMLFYGVGCTFCKISCKQISHMVRRNNLSTEQIAVLFWGDEERVAEFFEQSNAVDFDYTMVDAETVVNITRGNFPTMVFYDPEAKHKIVNHNINTIDDKHFVDLLR